MHSYAINEGDDDDDGDDGKIDLQVQYEESVLAPLRRRLSDVGSSASPIHTSSTTKSPLLKSIFLSDPCIENCKENEKNVKSTDCHANVSIADVSSMALQAPTTAETKATPDPPHQSQQAMKLKSCLSAPSNKKRQRSPLTTPIAREFDLNSNIHDDPSSPIIEPSRKKQRCNNVLQHSIAKLNSEQTCDERQSPFISRKAVHFAPSSAVEYEVEVPVCQSLTPIPAETAIRRYPTELKATSIEEAELIQITKQNYAILKAFDDMYDSDNDLDRVKRRRKQKKDRRATNSRRKSFYIPSTRLQNSSSDAMHTHIDDPLLHTI